MRPVSARSAQQRHKHPAIRAGIERARRDRTRRKDERDERTRVSPAAVDRVVEDIARTDLAVVGAQPDKRATRARLVHYLRQGGGAAHQRKLRRGHGA
eukprot:1426744-Pleurochrysis_carterae.AAC.2